MQKIGFIGCGKMAKAIIKGIVNKGFVASESIIATKSSTVNLESISDELGIKVILDNKNLVQESDVIFIAVKPTQVESVLDEIKGFITQDKLVVSVAAGITTNFIESNLTNGVRVVRVMPNTPVLVGEGMSGISAGSLAKKEDLDYVQTLFSAIGKTVLVDENQIDIVTAISGSGPAFFYKVINDIARAGEKLGMDYEKALLLSIQTALGSAKMAMNREVSMEELISNVATKGGCTRVGVDVMEESKISEIFASVIKDTAQKANALGK